jgi:hypothetical protein
MKKNMFTDLFEDISITNSFFETYGYPTVVRPTCINYGCDKLVATDGKRWRPHCSHCQGASYGKHPHRAGVTPFKTGKCSNIDGHLGFKCFTDWKLVEQDNGRIKTHIDHKDGDHMNNTTENCEELCGHCHDEKSRRSGNFKGYRY